MSNPVRFSHLRAFGRSALHGHYSRTSQEDDQTMSMERGSAVHHIVFGTKKIVGFPGAVRRGKEYESFVDRHQDCEILTQIEYEKSQRMADAVRQCKLAEPYLRGVCEETLMFRWFGLDCRATPDVRAETHLTELKTSVTAEPSRFTYMALRMSYHAQMRMQQIACKNTKLPCFIICVESSAPFAVTVFEIDKRTLEIGEKLLVTWMERLRNCESSNQFPAYSQSVYPLIAPEGEFFEYHERGSQDGTE